MPLLHRRRKPGTDPRTSQPRRLAVAVVTLASVLLLGTPAAHAAVPAAAPAAVTSAATAPADPRATSGTLLGQFVPRGDAATTEAAVQRTEEALGRRLAVHRMYQRWDDDLAVVAAPTVRRGRVPMLSVLPKRLDGTVLRWASLAQGAADAQIRAHAQQVRSLGPVVYLTLHHEADTAGATYGTAAEYVAAWRRYVEVFRAEGVTNVLWTWVPTTGALMRPTTDPTAKGFYPGDDVVDRIGTDAYNWFGCKSGNTAEWRSLQHVTEGLRAFAWNHGKKAVLAEWGSVEDPAQPERRAAWLRDAFALFASWDDLEAVAYFDTVGTCDWRLGTGLAARTYRDLVADAELNPRPVAWLEPSVTQGAGSLTLDLRGDRSTGAGSPTGAGVVSWSLDLGDGTTRSGTGQPPAALQHTYGAGTFTPTLRVTDALGQSATDVRTVTVAPAPAVTGVAERNVTTTAADLLAWVDTRGVAGTVTFEWRTGTTVVGTTSVRTAARNGTQEVSTTAPRGLTPGTRYDWTVTVTTDAGTASRADSWVTPGPPAVRVVDPAYVGTTSAQIRVRVTPNGAETTAWVEWGTTALDGSTAPVALGAVLYERAAQPALTGLSPRTTYRFRVVAENSYGRTVGPEQTFTTGG